MSGFFLLSHDLASPDHDLHPHSTGEPACRMAAWVDLIGMARWKDGGGLERGQLAHSERFLAVRWNRPRSWVTRFLDDLEAENRIIREPQAGRKPGHITICNYDTYQDPRTTSEATSEPRVGPRIGPRTGPKKKEEREKKKEELPTAEMWDIWIEELGGNPPQPRFTSDRKKKLASLYTERLADEDEPLETFRKILRAVKASDHHMSQRSYQMPESLFRGENRRDRWYMAAKNGTKPTNSPPNWIAGLEAEDGWGNE